MSASTATIITDYLLAGCALLALLLILPAASAAANRLRPGWRVWVYPAAFFCLLASAILSLVHYQANLAENNPVLKGAYLTAGLAVNFFVLNGLYRALANTAAWRVALVVWLIFGLFMMLVFMINSVLILTVYELLCSIALYVLYGSVFIREQERAADAVPIFIGTSLILIAIIINSFSFELGLGFITLSQSFFYQLFQVAAIFFFLKGGFHFYNVKYAEQRNQERILLANKQ